MGFTSVWARAKEFSQARRCLEEERGRGQCKRVSEPMVEGVARVAE